MYFMYRLHLPHLLSGLPERIAWLSVHKNTGICLKSDTVTMTYCSVLEFSYVMTAVHHCLHLSASHSCKSWSSSLHDCESLQCSATASSCMLTNMYTTSPELEHICKLSKQAVDAALAARTGLHTGICSGLCVPDPRCRHVINNSLAYTNSTWSNIRLKCEEA